MNNESYLYSSCVKTYEQIGETVYYNLCTGENQTLPWGVTGWFLFISLMIIALLIIVGMIAIIKEEWF